MYIHINIYILNNIQGIIIITGVLKIISNDYYLYSNNYKYIIKKNYFLNINNMLVLYNYNNILYNKTISDCEYILFNDIASIHVWLQVFYQIIVDINSFLSLFHQYGIPFCGLKHINFTLSKKVSLFLKIFHFTYKLSLYLKAL